MRLSYGMEAKQLQKQTLAPRMIQSMEILQMPIAALQERIDQELSENPMLEQQDVDPALPDVQDEDQERSTSLSDVERELVVQDNQSNADDFERLFNMDQEMPNTFDDFRRSSGRIDEDGDRYLDMMANAVARPESLNDYLLHQLAELDIDDQVEV
ncbi:MAG: RNA polymerase sigma-54 factor, partial [Candidatus Moraniibacteriota bacterium]